MGFFFQHSKMAFKIIQEIQKKGYVLTIIPDSFEQNSVFWYPPSEWSSRKRNAIMKNPHSRPDKKNWVPRPCKVKKFNIASYREAEALEEEMLSTFVTTEVDSESDDNSQFYEKANPRQKNINKTRSPQPSFEVLAVQCENDELMDANEEFGEIHCPRCI